MNEEKFNGKADVYTSFRPGYPQELYRFLFSELGFSPDTAVADVGAGTGIFSRPLAEHGCHVLAVEPNRDMRAAAREQNRDLQRFSVVDGNAQHTTLDDASVSRVTAAQAFHWFDPAAFASECRRILTPDGLALIAYNHRIPDDPVTRDTFAVNTRHCPAFKGFSGGFAGEDGDALHRFFRDGTFSSREFRHAYPLDEKAFVGRALSSSYAPRPGAPGYEDYIADLAAVFRRHARDGRVESRLTSIVYWGTV